MPDFTVKIPTLHSGQVAAWKVKDPATGKRPRFLAMRCGRRFGKTQFGVTVACNDAVKGRQVGWFAPAYKTQSEAYNDILTILAPVVQSGSKVDGIIRTITGGSVEFWTTSNNQAGRSRRYHRILLDEMAFSGDDMKDIFARSIMPTLLDFRGSAIVFSNTNGIDPDNFMWRCCNEAKLPENERYGFIDFHAPTSANPFMPKDEIERLRKTTQPQVFQQEYNAAFIDWSGAAFFNLEKLLDGSGSPLPYPTNCDTVFAVIDSAVKTGSANDGTAVTYFARNKYAGTPLLILDWDIVQIEGDLLDVWLKSVFDNLEHLARQCGAREGVRGVYIEDKSSGMVLIQQARKRFPAPMVNAIGGAWMQLGKDERALSVSSYHYQGKCKITGPAHDKTTVYKGASRNHLEAQVSGFRIGDKEAARRADDLLDTYVHGLALTFGDSKQF